MISIPSLPSVSTLLLPCLLCSCMAMTPAHLPSEQQISLRNGVAQGPDCRSLQDASEFNGGPLQLTDRPSVAFGCATYNNLAKMIANPQDLRQPRHYPGQSAPTAGAAVQRYYDNKVKELLSTATTSSGSNNNSASAGNGGGTTP